jgi:hypothetical protein
VLRERIEPSVFASCQHHGDQGVHHQPSFGTLLRTARGEPCKTVYHGQQL